MRRHFTRASSIVPVLAIGIALCSPAIAQAKGESPAELVKSAKTSPTFRKTVQRKQLAAAGLKKIEVSKGVTMDFQRYVTATALDRRAELRPLFDAKIQAQFLGGAPDYDESIHVLDDRLVVERRLTVPLAPGACHKPSLPAAVADLCFERDAGGRLLPSTARALASIRTKLARAPGRRIVVGRVTAAKAKRMTDAQLLDLLLNSHDRTIHHVSIVPRQPVHPGSKGVHLREFKTDLGNAVVDPGLEAAPPTVKPSKGHQHVLAMPETFDTKYFLTGFTWGKEVDDSWEYTFANSTWLTDRYYVRVDYHLGLGLGLRAPFSVDVNTAGSSTGRQVNMKVAPVNVDKDGSPAYPAVGLPKSKYFDGNEFVMELKAGCSLHVSIPGPNVDKDCPEIDKGFSRSINPVLGSDTSKIAAWWLDGKAMGLAVDVGVADASIDVGLGADVTNGRVTMRVSPLPGSSFQGLQPGYISLKNTQPAVFTVTRGHNAPDAGFRLHDPRYGFDVELAPKIRAKVAVDVGIYDNDWTLGPWALDFLSISKGFELKRHAGTVERHDYEVFHFPQPEVALDDPAPTQPTKPKPKPPTVNPQPPQAPKLPRGKPQHPKHKL